MRKLNDIIQSLPLERQARIQALTDEKLKEMRDYKKTQRATPVASHKTPVEVSALPATARKQKKDLMMG